MCCCTSDASHCSARLTLFLLAVALLRCRLMCRGLRSSGTSGSAASSPARGSSGSKAAAAAKSLAAGTGSKLQGKGARSAAKGSASSKRAAADDDEEEEEDAEFGRGSHGDEGGDATAALASASSGDKRRVCAHSERARRQARKDKRGSWVSGCTAVAVA